MSASQQSSTTRRANTSTQPAASATGPDKENHNARNGVKSTTSSHTSNPAADGPDLDAGPRTRRAAERRPTARQQQLDDEAAAAEARKAAQQVKAAKAAKRREAVAAGDEGDSDEDTPQPRTDDTFTSRVVPSRPTVTKALVQRASKVPDAPRHVRDRHTSPANVSRGRRDRHEDDHHCRRNSRSPVHFRGMSPEHPPRTPSPESKMYNINGGRVPSRLALNLFQDDESPVHEHRHRANSESPVRRSRSPVRRRSRSPAPRRRHSATPAPRRRLERRSPSPEADRSPSPVAGDKRPRSPTDDALRVVQAQRTSTSSRPKARDFDDLTQELLAIAIKGFRCLVATRHAFPDHATEVDWVGESWSKSCRKVSVAMELSATLSKLIDPQFTPTSARIREVEETTILRARISGRGSHLRGEGKTEGRPITELSYGFKSGQNKKTIKYNRELAEELKEDLTFTFKDPKARKGMYKQ
ncbi:hypothetical protein R3P38DRAFT_3375516 [Favolaschia claudopus]|uniref:DUF6532 domain-containing protein n=1 Tax=Favolaschia claudopus TaxID=2862362 RepID=A0AAV9ZIC7_9AGAR